MRYFVFFWVGFLLATLPPALAGARPRYAWGWPGSAGRTRGPRDCPPAAAPSCWRQCSTPGPWRCPAPRQVPPLHSPAQRKKDGFYFILPDSFLHFTIQPCEQQKMFFLLCWTGSSTSLHSPALRQKMGFLFCQTGSSTSHSQPSPVNRRWGLLFFGGQECVGRYFAMPTNLLFLRWQISVSSPKSHLFRQLSALPASISLIISLAWPTISLTHLCINLVIQFYKL